MRGSLSLSGAIVGSVLAVSIPRATADDAQDASVQRGAYLAIASDCVACHTVPGGKPFAGGLAIASPVGTIYSSNITPSATAGIGHYTEDQFARAVREGVRSDGANLYPAMPYTAYKLLTDADIQDLYRYFEHGVAPVDTAPKRTTLPFPMNIRLSMAAWNLLFLSGEQFQANAAQSAEWNRGKYLADGAAHCSTCHTPRGFLMEELPKSYLGGAQVGPWYAPNISKENEDVQPPHRQAAAYYKRVAGAQDGQFKVTMDLPSASKPKPTTIEISDRGGRERHTMMSASWSIPVKGT